MKRFFVNQLVVAALIVTAAFTSCDKDNDDSGSLTVLDIKVEGGSAVSDIDEVKLFAWIESNDELVELATFPFSNGGFKITFSEIVLPANILGNITNMSAEGLTISNPNVKFFRFEDLGLLAYSKGAIIGNIHHVKREGNAGTSADFIFVTEDVTVKGKRTEYWGSITFDLLLKQGWNLAYYTQKKEPDGKYDDTHTTTTPSGMKWVLAEW